VTRPTLNSISPFFIVRDVPRSLSFYCERLGFDVSHASPGADPFFAIVRRDGVQLFIKAIDATVAPVPNSQRHPWARWDAYVDVPDPDALAAEFASRGVSASTPLADTGDGLRGFEIEDPDGYVLFFGRPR
jgi:catechol 2,3-dioxygenase-like lactoylglutathione lyase family enzyme